MQVSPNPARFALFKDRSFPLSLTSITHRLIFGFFPTTIPLCPLYSGCVFRLWTWTASPFMNCIPGSFSEGLSNPNMSRILLFWDGSIAIACFIMCIAVSTDTPRLAANFANWSLRS